MEEATIRFEGEAFHGTSWDQLLRQMGYRLSGGSLPKAVSVPGGINVAAESLGFIRRDGQDGYEWRVTFNRPGRWESAIKFYALLLAAFAMPQPAVVTLAGGVFTDRAALRAHAEAALIQEFSLDELIDRGAYRPGDGVQFV